jgi:sulfur-oxidizing protein SoxY
MPAPLFFVAYHRCTMLIRREVLQAAGVASMLAAAGLLPRAARAQTPWNRAAFEAKSVDEVAQALGIARPVKSPLVTLQADDLSENGAQVPIGVACSAPRVQRIALLVEKNPNTLAAVFELGETVEPALRTNIKMGQSSNVYAVAITADRQVLYAVKHIGVTLGGCGE